VTEDSVATNGVTSFEVRAELEDRLERDLLGPWDGPEEELPPSTPPAARYLLGRLVPRPSPTDAVPAEATTDPREATDAEEADPSLFDREVSASDDAGEEDPEGETTVRSGTMAASAIGLAFSVPASVDVVSVTASWGRYERGPSEVHVTEQGRPRVTWHRRPAGGPVEIRLDAEDADYVVPDAEQEGVTVHYTVRHRGPRRVVELALVNGQIPTGGSPDVTRLYQAGLTVTALDGHAAIFLGHNDPELSDTVSENDDELRHLALLHRSKRQYSSGRQCAVDAFVRDGERRAWKLSTTCFPSAEVPLVVPGHVPGLVLDMTKLGSPELGGEELVRALRPLVTGYQKWLNTQQEQLADAEVARYAPAGEHAIQRARDVAGRLERAIDLLRDDPIAREAFRFANQAMALQRVRSELVRSRLANPGAEVAALLREHDVPKNRSWRPFQLAFVLLCLPGLTDPEHPDAHRGAVDPGDAAVQLLFFPTGGGKTEAYLGLTAYTFAIRRLQGVSGSGADARDATRGVAVLMRYTLRLLTAQQFQRASALVCACEWLRRERLAAGDSRWGATPFRIGLWVGKSVTPNDYDDAERQINETRGQERMIGGPMQLAACPWCGSRLSGSHDLKTKGLRRRVLLFCSDPEGDCPFTERRSPRDGLPVLTVDEEIYRLTPSLVIATVDKLAQLPWNAATAPLFGLVATECTRHGWQNPEFSFCGSRHYARPDEPAAEIGPVTRLRPPDLIIQDELHLISDALGSMVGLYETAIDRLCTYPRDGHMVRPVLVASTATVRRAADQTEQVFARGLTVFPPPVLDAGDTFFSTTVKPSKDSPGRRYRGVLAPGERLKAVEIRVVSTLMEHAQFLFDRYGDKADPYMTVVDYFTSTRELAGMRRLVEDDVSDRLSSLQVRTRRRRPRVDELTGRMPSSKIAENLAELERPFDPAFDSTAALDEFRRDPAAARERTARRQQPIDVLLATSMLQVGVDVQRLGLMVVTGQPKNTAEYIQATSRVGRSRERPGLVVMIYQWSRPRDLAHCESFGYDHATFGLHVEGLTTTPFSDRALDRGLTGVLVTALRHSGMAALPNEAAQTVALSGAAINELVGYVAQRAERVTHEQAQAEQVTQELQHRLDSWRSQRKAVQTGSLGYEEARDVTGLLHKPDEGSWGLWSAPLSLREVEAEILLQLDRDDRSLPEAPPWNFDRTPSGAGS
jgi:Helicase conserved C-terminal domain